MALHSIGDLAQEFVLRRQVVSVTREMDRLTREVSTGQAADIARHLLGNLQPLADIERALVLAEAHRDAARLAATDAAIMQTALERVQTEAGRIAERALAAAGDAAAVLTGPIATEARAALAAIVGALNSTSAGRALLVGDATERVPLAPAETLLAELRAALAAASDAASLSAALDGFFDVPNGGFFTGIYRGGIGQATGYALGAGESVALRIRADDPALRDQIKQVAMVAMLDDPALPLDAGERRALAQDLGVRLLAGQDGIARLRAELGSAEARIAQSGSRIAAETTALTIARNDLISVDVSGAAVALEGVQFQLQAIYTVAARTARLNLAAFLS